MLNKFVGLVILALSTILSMESLDCAAESFCKSKFLRHNFLLMQVTTRRTQGAEKALVPRWNDSVSKLPGVGKETINKLKDLHAVGFTHPLGSYKITTGELSTIS